MYAASLFDALCHPASIAAALSAIRNITTKKKHIAAFHGPDVFAM